MDFSLHGKPSFIESCNSSWQDACLNIHWFLSLENVQDNLDKWRSEYHRRLVSWITRHVVSLKIRGNLRPMFNSNQNNKMVEVLSGAERHRRRIPLGNSLSGRWTGSGFRVHRAPSPLSNEINLCFSSHCN
ncbi:TPA: transposase [Kluyvera ascorbata]|uniref:integrase core domain-containing protein n=1 Tax=Enterobacteriaceae TaxID=543 RepID=UPI000D12CF83|nr:MULTISPECIES: integrase core domain-containing protein [Enterobacteriaceae]HAT3917414.1 transposase [Kluyvera ascorbata]HAT3942327.1 transposase [Kluyvera ascorbata]HAT3946691.1 transposase [Kluyvera ascorbata]